tara:strand:+ start:192 stop:530 length:339 start_codon:yes stop_codon:yes gene_type:complete
MYELPPWVFIPDQVSCQRTGRWLGVSNPDPFLLGRPHVRRDNRRRGGGAESRGKRWGVTGSQDLPPVRHQQAAVQTFLDFDTGTGVAGAVEVRIQLQGAPVILDSVVFSHTP